MELALRLFTDYAEAQGWPEVGRLTASNIEDYLVYLRERPRWFGKRGRQKTPMSDSSVETNYRRLKTFLYWLVERGHVSKNPPDLIKHPRCEERVIPTVALTIITVQLLRKSIQVIIYNRGTKSPCV